MIGKDGNHAGRTVVGAGVGDERVGAATPGGERPGVAGPAIDGRRPAAGWPPAVEDERLAGFDALFTAEYEPMVRLSYLTLGSRHEAEEVVQEAFAEVHDRWRRLARPGAYLRTTVVNRSIDVLRRRRRSERFGLVRVETTTDLGAHELTDVLATLSPRRRAVVVLRYYEGLRVAGIAELIGVRPATVMSMLHRALSQLREELER